MEGEENANQQNEEQNNAEPQAESPKSPAEAPKPPSEVPAKQEDNVNTSKRSDINKSHENAAAKPSKPAAFKISKESVKFSAAISASEYVISKIWKRFEARQYIESVIYPKVGAYIQDEVFKFGPYLLDKYDFAHDTGESQSEQDDEFHIWQVEDDYLPPKADAHASDRAMVSQVQVFSHSFPNSLSEIPYEGDDSPEVNKKSRKNVYLNMNNIMSLDKSSGSHVKSPAFDSKSTASKMQSLNKYKLNAKKHLFGSPESIKEIVQIPIPEETKPEKKVC